MPDKRLKKRIRDNYRAQGGVRKSLQWAARWVKENKKDRTSHKAEKLGGDLHPGKIHLFNYHPITKTLLSHYDKNPLVLSLGKNQYGYDLGINLNFLPMRMRWDFLEFIDDRFGSAIDLAQQRGGKGEAKRQDPILIQYALINNTLKKTGIDFAIRSYSGPDRSDTYVFSYDSWDKLALLDERQFIGISATQIYEMFRRG